MKRLIFAFTAVMTFCVVEAKPEATKKLSWQERHAQYLERIKNEGGLVKIAGKGSVVVYDLRSNPDLCAIRESWQELAKQLRITFEAKSGKGSFSLDKVEEMKRQAGGEAVVFVVEDPLLPITLAAQEAKWSVLNVTPLLADKPAPAKFSKRFTVALLRAAARAIGSDVSRFDTSFLAAANEAKDFDSFKGTDLTFDVQMGILSYVPTIGIEANDYVSYKAACEEGIDIAPTNDLQRTIRQKFWTPQTNQE